MALLFIMKPAFVILQVGTMKEVLMSKKFIWIFAFGIGLLLAGVCDAKLYQWVDQDGVLHISSSPPPVEAYDDGSSNQ